MDKFIIGYSNLKLRGVYEEVYRMKKLNYIIHDQNNVNDTMQELLKIIVEANRSKVKKIIEEYQMEQAKKTA